MWNRKQELAALGELDGGGGLAVVWGRRRIGKTRLLLEWTERGGGVYTVADQSAPDLQRAYFARAISQSPRGGKRSLYKIDDPFLRLWFRVVAPNRAALTAGTPASRAAVLDEHWPLLLGQAWEELCQRGVPTIRGALARMGPWRPPSRYWHGADPAWDLVADASDGRRVLLGEAWFSARRATAAVLVREAERLARRPVPAVIRAREVVRALFVPAAVASAPKLVTSVHIVTLADLQGRAATR